jgi:hypothetical protein
MLVHAAHIARISDPDFWRRLEARILQQINTNTGWDLRDVVSINDSLCDYRQFSQEFKDNLTEAIVEHLERGQVVDMVDAL